MVNFKTVLVALMASAAVCVSCYAQEAPIKVFVATSDDVYTMRDDIHVIVTIKNTSGQMVNARVAPVFTLAKSDLQIWAPVRLDGKRDELKRGETSLLTLEPFEERALEYNLSRAKWESIHASVWPTKPLTSIILIGKYTLSFEIRKQNGADTEIVSSNPLPLEIISEHL
ncbi:MAG: hypothetical protein PHV55_02130 [Candidatus Omnitrophica bacterium]|nr:hypothetical protein [Candidatus Omnitrophota bacterium]